MEALWTHKVKLGATLSRMKVHAGALNIAQLLPESTRERFCEVTTEPIYVRVNADIDVTSRICAAGFKLIGRSEQLVSCSTLKSTCYSKITVTKRTNAAYLNKHYQAANMKCQSCFA